MKKKVLTIAFMAAIAFAAGMNIAQSENEASLSDITLNNVEALANSEGDFWMCANVIPSECVHDNGYTVYGLKVI